MHPFFGVVHIFCVFAFFIPCTAPLVLRTNQKQAQSRFFQSPSLHSGHLRPKKPWQRPLASSKHFRLDGTADDNNNNDDNDDDSMAVGTGNENGRASWLFSLSLPLWLVFISNQWSRASIYYLVDFSPNANPFNAMNVDIGFSEAEYGLLASIAFTSLYAIASLGAGIAADRYNRKTLTIVSACTWSAATLGTALSHSYLQIVLCRILMGLACAFSGPTAYTLIRERAPPGRVALATSFFGTGVAVASALSSLSILLDTELGWRNAYNVVGLYGLAAVVISGLLLEDDSIKNSPPSGDSTQMERPTNDTVTSNVWDDVLEVFSTRRVQLILIGSLFRFSSGLMIGGKIVV